MKPLLLSALAAITLAAFTSCGAIAIQSLETKYGTLSTNQNGSYTFTSKTPIPKAKIIADK